MASRSLTRRRRPADDRAVLTALRIEGLALGSRVTPLGMGPLRAGAGASRLARKLAPGTPVALVGVSGGLDPDLVPGDLVVATEVRTLDGGPPVVLPGAELVASELRHLGLAVRTGPIVSVDHLVRPAERAELAATGALAVDMESAAVAAALSSHPLVVVRAIADTARRGPVRGGIRGLAALHRVRPAIERWSRATGPHEVVLAAPRSFCAGVERAIEIVERAIERFGAPVYVRRQIVHNAHVVGDLEARGAVFVEELHQVPDGATVVLAAHGVSPEVRRQATEERDLFVIDATCPLVAKVHHEARRFAERNFHIALIGHTDHEEVAGTLGEAPGRITVIERVADVAALETAPGTPLAYLTQTTLATDETAEIVEALRQRFPDIAGPSQNDICYATQNRQDAVRALAERCELILVVGSANSSNTVRLVEVARRHGRRAELLEDASELRLGWFDGVATVGLTAGASAPEVLVQEVIDALGRLGPTRVDEHRITEETVRFSLPQQVR